MIKKILVNVSLFLTFITYAQEGTSSVYSLHGIGIQKFRGTVSNTSTGGLSLFSNKSTPNLLNPALYGGISLTSIAVGGTFNSTNLKSNGREAKTQTTSFDYLSIVIPTNLFGFGFGLVPVSAAGYDLETIDENNGQRILQKGKGGINRVYLGVGTKSYKGFRLGAEIQYNFGRLENEVIIFPSQDLVRENIRQLDQTDASGFSYTFSGVYDTTLKENLQLRTSLIYSFSNKFKFLNSTEVTSISEGGDGQIIIDGTDGSRIIDAEDKSFSLPSRITFGASLLSNQKWAIGAEFFTGNTGDFQDRFTTRDNIKYTDPYGFKLGGFFQPNYNSLTSYFQRITYKAGARYEKLGLQFNNKDISEFGISFGLSLPLPRGLSTVDLGGEVGLRGTTSNGALQENFFNFSIGLSLSDKWFRKRKFN